jgi:hypothetical protein
MSHLKRDPQDDTDRHRYEAVDGNDNPQWMKQRRNHKGNQNKDHLACRKYRELQAAGPWHQFQLHPVGPAVLSGLIVHPFSAAGEVLRYYRQAPTFTGTVAAAETR